MCSVVEQTIVKQRICSSLAEKLKKILKFDLIVSPAMGGVVIGYEIGRILGKETIFAERVNGKFELRRGFEITKNQKILIVEDVITTEKSSLECTEMINKHNGNVIGYACIIDRSNDKSLINKSFVSQIKIDIPTYDKNVQFDHLKNKTHKNLEVEIYNGQSKIRYHRPCCHCKKCKR